MEIAGIALCAVALCAGYAHAKSTIYKWRQGGRLDRLLPYSVRQGSAGDRRSESVESRRLRRVTRYATSATASLTRVAGRTPRSCMWNLTRRQSLAPKLTFQPFPSTTPLTHIRY